MNIISRQNRRLSLTIGLLCSISLPFFAGHAYAGSMPIGTATTAPPGYTQFCKFNRTHCDPSVSFDRPGRHDLAQQINLLAHTHIEKPILREDSVFGISRPDKDDAFQKQNRQQLAFPSRLNEKFWTILSETNSKINNALIPVTDMDQYGVIERWELPLTKNITKAGDCEDYALEKRKMLIDQGVSPSSLFFAVGHHKSTGRHAVLVVATDQGDFVLDNMTQEILPWHKTRYRWIKRQSGLDPSKWSSLENS